MWHRQDCISNYVAPLSIKRRIKKANIHNADAVERTFLKDELARTTEELLRVKSKFNCLYKSLKSTLSLFDFIRFSALLSKKDLAQNDELRKKYRDTLERLRQERYGSTRFNHDYIINLSDKSFTDIEKDVLSKGTDFRVPPRIKRVEVLADFEMFYRDLAKNKVTSSEASAQCQSSLQFIAHKVSTTKPDMSSYPLTKEHRHALRSLKANDEIVISRPDKGRATVILNRTDYNAKMLSILEDDAKFRRLGPADSSDRTNIIEQALVDFLRTLKNQSEISETLFDRIKPIGSSRPRLYGLPKIHKPDCPLRPILSMSGSPQYKVSVWLCTLLDLQGFCVV